MPVMERRPWTHEELVKVLALYYQIPFGKMHARNPAVVALASTIDRTPSAVALKLVNFASLDPELRERGVSGMPNTSQADRQIWTEFYGRWDALADASVVDVVETVQPSLRARELEPLPPSGSTEVTREATVRRGQSFFRGAVMAAHDWKCCVTGITALELLRASHIVPWSQNVDLRLDPRNGLCLNALHDAAFDRGLITFSTSFELCLSSRLKNEVPNTVFKEMFESRCGAPIVMPERFMPTSDMIEFHRSKVFCG
jgi:putative restriction endonuclease